MPAVNAIRPPGPVAAGLKIALFGGSFNPAHAGHVYVAEAALKRIPCDYVWWLVSPGNPLKSAAGMADAAVRLAGARAIARHPRFIVTGIERDLGSRYTVDTVRALKTRFPSVKFVWLMGSDNLEQFDRWKNWEKIAALLPIAVAIRPGSTLAALRSKAYRRFGAKRFRLIDGRRNETSASAIRALAKKWKA
jgi:nicotinate-nucleotide adenylyltransferase